MERQYEYPYIQYNALTGELATRMVSKDGYDIGERTDRICFRYTTSNGYYEVFLFATTGGVLQSNGATVGPEKLYLTSGQLKELGLQFIDAFVCCPTACRIESPRLTGEFSIGIIKGAEWLFQSGLGRQFLDLVDKFWVEAIRAIHYYEDIPYRLPDYHFLRLFFVWPGAIDWANVIGISALTRLVDFNIAQKLDADCDVFYDKLHFFNMPHARPPCGGSTLDEKVINDFMEEMHSHMVVFAMPIGRLKYRDKKPGTNCTIH